METTAHVPGSVVVGIDGSEGSTTALAWAAGEAARTGADLRLLAVVEERHVPRFPPRLGHDDAVKLLDQNLQEEKNADKLLNDLALGAVNRQAA